MPSWQAREVAGAGFINFFLTPDATPARSREFTSWASAYGASSLGAGQRVIVEFVSANPTGPLHVGHGRQAAYGATLANLLAATGHQVHREYYINDAGRQMDILAVERLAALSRAAAASASRFPATAIAATTCEPSRRRLQAQTSAPQLRRPGRRVFADLPPDAPPATRKCTSMR